MEHKNKNKNKNKVKNKIPEWTCGELMKKNMSSQEALQHLFKEGVKITTGDQSRRYNLLAAKLISYLIKSSLGPKGLEKVYVDILGEATLTKDGSTFLRKIDVEHPAAKILIDASNAVDNEVGDGTITVVVLVGALIEKAEELLNIGISPAVIIDGYNKGLEISLDRLQEISQRYSNSDDAIMKRLVSTCLKSKAIHWNGTLSNMFVLSRIVVDAMCSVTDFKTCRINIDDIKIEEKLGNTDEIQLIKGIVLDKTIDNSAMPRSLDHVRILLIDAELDYERPKGDIDIEISSPNQIQLFRSHQHQTILKKVECIIDSKANVVIARKGINNLAQTNLSRAGIISIRRVKENDLLWLQKATGAKIVVDLDDIEAVKSNLGLAGKVYEKKVGEDKMIFIDECNDPKSVTILLRANSKKILDEYHRSILDAIAVLKDFVMRPLVVGGAGSVESALVSHIKERIKRNHKGKELIVLEKFADAVEEIPLTIARNAGMNITDVAIKLRTLSSKDNSTVNGGRKPYWYGIDVFDRKVRGMFSDAIEPVLVKEQIMKTAIEVTNMLLRIDDVLISKPIMNTHTHADGTTHSHAGGNKSHDHFDKLGKQQRPMHHYY